MKAQLYDGSRKIRVNTQSDECLYAGARPSNPTHEFNHQGKDLYIHTDKQQQITYYMHLWSTSRGINDKIIPVSPTNAERFLRGKGIICNLFPKGDPISRLYEWGYGIAEEF